MFILMTIISIWFILITDAQVLERTMPAHDIASLRILLSPGGGLLALLWIFALCIFFARTFVLQQLSLLRSGRRSKTPTARPNTSTLFLALDNCLIGVGLLLASCGWSIGARAPFLLGATLAIGLALARLEYYWLNA